MAEPRHIMWLW